MKLLIIRHGPAGDPEAWQAEGRDDRLRPLTPKGKKEVRKAATGLHQLVPTLDLLATSPWIRAAETARLVGKEYGCEVTEIEALTSEQAPKDLAPWLHGQRGKESVGLVGHEPHLGLLVGYLLSGKSASFIELKKGGACLVEMEDPSRAGSGILQWLLTNRELRRLAE